MPELSRFYGILVKMLFSDTDKHHKPHVHVYYNDYSALIGIDGEILAGSLPVKQMKLIQAWLSLHEDELYIAWAKAVKNEHFDKIAPLQ